MQMEHDMIKIWPLFCLTGSCVWCSDWSPDCVLFLWFFYRVVFFFVVIFHSAADHIFDLSLQSTQTWMCENKIRSGIHPALDVLSFFVPAQLCFPAGYLGFCWGFPGFLSPSWWFVDVVVALNWRSCWELLIYSTRHLWATGGSVPCSRASQQRLLTLQLPSVTCYLQLSVYFLSLLYYMYLQLWHFSMFILYCP